LNWPHEIVNAFDVVAVSTLQVNFSPLTCLFEFNSYQMFISYALLPWVGAGLATLVFFLLFFYQVIYGKASLESNRNSTAAIPMTSGVINVQSSGNLSANTIPKTGVKRRLFDAYITTIVIIVFLSHPLVTKNALEMFECSSYDIGDNKTARYLANDMNIMCNGPQYVGFTIGAAIVLAIFSFGVPFMAFITLFRNRNRLEKDGTQRRYRFLYQGFVDRAYYWEFVIMIRKVGIILIIVFSTNVSFQAFGALWLLVLCIMLHLTFKPFRYKAVDLLELLGLAAVFVTFLAGLTFYENGINPILNQSVSALLMAFVILFNIFVICYGIILVILDRFFDPIVNACEKSESKFFLMIADLIHYGFVDRDKVKAYQEAQNIPKRQEIYRGISFLERQKKNDIKGGNPLASSSNMLLASINEPPPTFVSDHQEGWKNPLFEGKE